MNQELVQWMKPRIGPMLGLAALVLYTGTLANFAVPGESAQLIAEHTGRSPFPELLHPLWGLFAWGIAHLPFGTVAARLNVFSSLCGAMTIWLVYELVSRLRFNPRYEAAAPNVHIIAGIAAAAFLAVCSPFWLASNRAHTASFDLLVLVGALLLLHLYKESGDRRRLMAFALLYGLGTAEFATFIALAPFLGAYAMLLMWRATDLNKSVLKRAGRWFLAGLALYLVGALQFRFSPAYAWRGFTNGFQILWYTWVGQWSLIARSLPKVGWLLVLLVSLLPWTLSMIAAKYQTRAGRVLSLALFHIVITALALVILFNGPIAPWSVLGARPLLVTPYLLIASTFGYAIGHWYILLARRLAALPVRPRLAETAAVLAVALTAASAAIHNAAGVNARAAWPFQRWAREVVRTLPPRTWLVTDGLLDDVLALAGAESGRDIHCIAIRNMRLDPYRKYVASHFDSPRLKGLAQISLPAFLREWARTDPRATDTLAVIPSSDLWRDARLEAVPERVLYGGRRALDGIDAGRLLASHEEFWNRVVPPLQGLLERPDEFGRTASVLVLNLSRIANDLGVTLETMGRPALAEKAYAGSRTIEPNNLSALLNLHILLEKAGRADDAKKLWNQVENVLSHPDPKWPLFRIVQKYGRINSRAALERVRSLWGAARPRDKASDVLKKAVQKYLAGEPAQAAAILEMARRDFPASDEAWIMSGMLAYERNDTATLDLCIQRMQAQRKEWAPFLVILGDSALARDDAATARRYYEKALARQPLNVRVHEALVKLDLAERDFGLLTAHLNELLAIDPGNAWGNLALGTMETQRGEYGLAEAALLKSIGRAPNSISLNNLAWVYHKLGRDDLAINYVLRSLDMKAEAPEAWDTLGVILVTLNRNDKAEQAFRQSLRLDPANPEPWTHLRELLLNQGRTRDVQLLTNTILASSAAMETNRFDLLRELREENGE